MRKEKVWALLLGSERTVVESVEIGDEQVVVTVRPDHRQRDRCGVCGRRALGFDLGEGRRRWRAPDLGTTIAHLEADAPRVAAPSTAWSSAPCPGPGTARASPAPSPS